jgi:hypothetical protein
MVFWYFYHTTGGEPRQGEKNKESQGFRKVQSTEFYNNARLIPKIRGISDL